MRKKVCVTMAYHQCGKKNSPIFPEEGAKKPKDMKEWVGIREKILSELYENKKPGVVYHGHISRYNVKSSDPNCRWVRVNFKDTEKRSCTLDESLRGEWWWYGHHGEEGITRAEDVKVMLRDQSKGARCDSESMSSENPELASSEDECNEG